MIKFREDLQILRGFAVTIVVLYHLKVFGFNNGYLGVDLFFVLSGYLMTRLSQKTTILEFYKRRYLRLIPAYVVTLFLTSLIVIIIAVPSDSNQVFNQIWFDLFALSNIGFWVKDSYFGVTQFKPLLNLWSLGVEIQFYILAPFLIPFLRCKKLLLPILLILSFILSLFLLMISPKTSFFMMPTRLWEFLFGSLVALYPLNNIADNKKKILSLLSLIILLIVIFAYPIRENYKNIFFGHPGFASLLVVISTAVLISTGLHHFFRSGRIFRNVMTKLGDYSYSIYLTHFPIIVLINYTPFGGTVIGHNNFKDLIIILSITVIMSYFMYNYIEIIRFKKSLKLINVIILVFLTSLLMLVFFGSSIQKIKYNNKQSLIFEAIEDRAIYRCGKLSRILSPLSSFCQINSVNHESKVLLLGDSHSDSIKVAFSDVMNSKKISTYFYIHNNPLVGPVTSSQKIAKEINLLDIKKVVMHFHINYYKHHNKKTEIEKFINLMKIKGIEVLFISPIPTYDSSIPKLMYEKTMNKNIVSTKQNLEDYLALNKDFFNFMEDIKFDTNKIYLTQNYLCNYQSCITQIDNYPIYFDKSHLNLKGSNILKPLFEEMAKK